MIAPNIIRQDEINVIFVRSELDDAGLDPFEFRVYAHIARRTNCFAKMDKIGAICGMSGRQARRALISLTAKGMIELIERSGSTHLITLMPPRNWSEAVWVEIRKNRSTWRGLYPEQGTDCQSRGVDWNGGGGWTDSPPKDIPLGESNRREGVVAAEAAPLPPEELRSLKAKPHSPTPSSAPAPSPCPWHVALGSSLPENLRTQNCLEAAQLWLQHKKEKHQKYSTVGFRRVVKAWGEQFNPTTFVRAVEHSVQSGYAGIFLHPDDKRVQQARPVATPSEPDPFDNKPAVTLSDIISKFGNGQLSVTWANRMRAAGRMR